MKDADRKNHHSEYSCSQRTWIRFQPLMAYVLSQMQLSTKGNRDCWINVKRLHIGVHLIFSARPHQQLLSVMMYSSLAEPIFTSAGISAGIDMALRIVSYFFGKEVGQATARHMEYPYPQDDGRRYNI